MSEDLARRAVACRHWRWAPGMLADSDDYGSWRLYESGPHLSACGVRGGFVAAWDAIADAERMNAYPALDDPCTVGALLALVREAWGCHVHLRRWASPASDMSGRDRSTWEPVDGLGRRLVAGPRVLCDTEAEALVVALEAAP